MNEALAAVEQHGRLLQQLPDLGRIVLQPVLAKVVAHSGSGVYGVDRIDESSTAISNTEFQAVEMNGRTTVPADRIVTCIPLRGYWGFL